MKDLSEKKVSMTIVPISAALASVIGLCGYYYFGVEETTVTTPVKTEEIRDAIHDIQEPETIDIYDINKVGNFVKNPLVSNQEIRELYERIVKECGENLQCRKTLGLIILEGFLKHAGGAPNWAGEFCLLFCGDEIRVLAGPPVFEMEKVFSYPNAYWDSAEGEFYPEPNGIECQSWLYIKYKNVLISHSKDISPEKASRKWAQFQNEYNHY